MDHWILVSQKDEWPDAGIRSLAKGIWVAKLMGCVAKFMKRPAMSTQWVRLVVGLQYTQSIRVYWVPPPTPLQECLTGGTHSLAGKGVGGPNSDDRKESLALSIICSSNSGVTQKSWATCTKYRQQPINSCCSNTTLNSKNLIRRLVLQVMIILPVY